MSSFEATYYYFRQAAQVMDLSPRVQSLLINPDKEMNVEIAIELDKSSRRRAAFRCAPRPSLSASDG